MQNGQEGQNAFLYATKVGYSSLDDKITIRPSNLVGILQDTAIAHSDEGGYNLKWFLSHNLGWVLLFWHIRISRLPAQDEELKVLTWAVPYKRAQANRDFLILDSRDREVAYASSRWVLLHSDTRRPVKLYSDFFSAYLYDTPRDFREENFQMVSPDNMEPLSQSQVAVTRRDADFNGHANNTAYVDWAVDEIPVTIYENYSIVDIRVEYKRECLPGTTIDSRTYIRTVDEEQKEFLSIFSNTDDPKIIHSKVSTIWKKNF